MADLSHFVGRFVRLNCGGLGSFEGEVSNVDAKKQTLSLKQACLDGTVLPCSVEVHASDIKDLLFIEKAQLVKPQRSTTPGGTETTPNTQQIKQMTPSKSGGKGRKDNSASSRRTRTTSLRKDKECFEEPTGPEKIPDFDFEKNLALFNKKAVFEELENSGAAAAVNKFVKAEKKLKCNENVLESLPVSLLQITAPLEHIGREFHSDEGIVVPSISLKLKKKLIEMSEKMGYSADIRTENAGICTCQMSLQVLGGSQRMSPENAHQVPTIVVMIGPHMQGAEGICAARHLANHNTKVYLFIPCKTELLVPQLALYMQTGEKLVSLISELPTSPVDLVIDALVGHAEKEQIPSDIMKQAVQWANQNKAPVLSLDPCAHSCKTGMTIKWSLNFGLPLINTPGADRVFLADIGIPKGIYSSVGISYISPFGVKSVIPLNST